MKSKKPSKASTNNVLTLANVQAVGTANDHNNIVSLLRGIITSAKAFAAEGEALSYLTFRKKPYWSTVLLVSDSEHLAFHRFQEDSECTLTSLLKAATAGTDLNLYTEPDGTILLKQLELQHFLDECLLRLQNEF